MQAPHLSLTIQARGMLDPTFTRVYFADEEAANATDPVLLSVPAERRATLIAALVESAGSSVPTYRFDIRYQGDDETAFFDV
jgi:protocatechuate 3,4-dioxygenase alpha subunit